MVVGDVSLEDVLEQLSGSEKTIGRPINPTVYSAAGFKSKLTSGNHLKQVLSKHRPSCVNVV